MKSIRLLTLALTSTLALGALLAAPPASAQVPQILNYQGKVHVGATPFTGSGQFRFALVNADGTTTFWSNDGTSTAGSAPTAAVALPVLNGLYAVLLGDTGIAGMLAVPPSVFANPDVRLRVWFDDGTTGSERIAPDQRIAAVGYAMVAGTASVADGSITAAKLALGAVGSTQLGSGLTLGGTTSGTFSGALAGNATTATSAMNFTGSLAGDVAGPQDATVVGAVGGSSAANVNIATVLANAAASGNTASALVLRDASGNFSAGTITLGGGLSLPTTSSANVGVLTQGGSPLLHSFGTNNFFAGAGAGNFSMGGTANTAVGTLALANNNVGSNNTALGYQALNANSGTGHNTAVGYQALKANLFGTNTAIGSLALQANTSGTFNLAVGGSALSLNVTGNQNTAVGVASLLNSTASSLTAVGFQALNSNTTGTQNTAVGAQALLINTSGGNNTAVGYRALIASVGNNNSAFGASALINNNGGSNNTAYGSSALSASSTGSSNIAIGQNAGNLLTTGSNNIDIGNVGVAAENSTIRIGTAGIQTRAFIAGTFGGFTGGGSVAVLIDGTGQLGTVPSSRRYKEDIADMGDASARLQALRPVTFHYKQPNADGSKPVQYGLIAEEVAETFPELAVFNAEGQPETVKYQDLAPLLLNEVQKLRAEKEQMAARLEKLEAAVNALGTK